MAPPRGTRAGSKRPQAGRASARRSPESARVARAVAGLIRALGLDVAAEPELRQTPQRVADLYAEIFAGLDPGAEPRPATFPVSAVSAAGARRAGDVVILRDLPFYSLCVHHFVPFFGHAHVAYLPGRRLIGLSGVARVLEHYARRPQVQERLTTQVADHLMRLLCARGVAVVIEGRHLCMEMRGVRKTGVFETRAVRGALARPEWGELLARGPGAGSRGGPASGAGTAAARRRGRGSAR
jgi:GTP cyclohydrolase I